ncbi:hypothetical protein JW979_04315 [bacterium]|nr:hypothetical protein [candidate division CSSED10-310 bacterium]
MTVVNAIRFNEYSGAMVCDEQVSWGDMSRKGDVGDKIQTIIPPEIQNEYGVVAAYGGSGTSAVSEEIKTAAYNMLREEAMRRKKQRMTSKKFMTIQNIADGIFENLSEMKRRHVDEFLKHRYGFTGADLIRGFYMGDKGKTEIQQKEIIDDAQAAMTWRGRYPQLSFLYVNRGILSGYEPEQGFRIFYFNMMTFSYEPVQAVFQSIGSGQDTSDLAFADFVSAKTVQERRDHLDPVESMVSIIYATNLASTNNIGVGGYYNIVVIDGHKPHDQRLLEIADERAKLASETVAAYKAEIITKKLAFDIVGEVILGDTGFQNAERSLFKRCRSAKALSRFLRGYKPEENILAKSGNKK